MNEMFGELNVVDIEYICYMYDGHGKKWNAEEPLLTADGENAKSAFRWRQYQQIAVDCTTREYYYMKWIESSIHDFRSVSMFESTFDDSVTFLCIPLFYPYIFSI